MSEVRGGGQKAVQNGVREEEEEEEEEEELREPELGMSRGG